ncbi:hypothetical protein GCM10010517_49550 [Streptosporangium fragile]|uniref:STAS domain-containing protein n=1 Tax=Streptosporangium fragile TaxID=46186 RepID=A0ABN3W2K1_9ACTN
MPTLDPVEIGEHVCWIVDPALGHQGYKAVTSTFLADGELFGDKVVIVGSLLDTSAFTGGTRGAVVVDPRSAGADAAAGIGSMLGLVRREADRAGRQGYRALRVLAVMDELVPPGVDVDELLAHELRLDEFVADREAIVVCAYGGDRFGAALGHVACVHHLELESEPRRSAPSFRMYNSGPGVWSVCGAVDADGAEVFRAALVTAAALAPTLRLRFDELELMDAAGMRALVEAATHSRVRRITVEGANATVRLCWEMLGYGTYDVPVELAR